MALVTPEEVFEYTRIEVSEDEVAQAQVIVELEAGTFESSVVAGNVSSHNAELLARAVAFQTVWMKDHPDVYSAMDVSSVSQDGVSGQFRGDWAQYLAPIAKRHLDRLTWKTKPLQVRARRARFAESLRGNRDSAAFDDQRRWSPT